MARTAGARSGCDVAARAAEVSGGAGTYDAAAASYRRGETDPMHGFGQDIRYAWRTLAKAKSFVFAAVISLALGIGINTSIFSVMYTATERPVSGREPAQLVDLSLQTRAGNMPLSYPEYLGLRKRTRAFSDVMGIMQGGRYRLGGAGNAQMASGVCVSDNFFPGFGQQPALGRGFPAGAGGGEAVITDGFWKRRFGRDPGVLGSPLVLHQGGRRFAYTIVGVMPPNFRIGSTMWSPDLVLPMPDDAALRNGKARPMGVMARVKPGLSMAQARAETELLVRQLGGLYPESFGKARLNFRPKVRRDAGTRMAMAAVQAVVGIILLIACANVMNLLLARHQARRAEMATRLALGATRGRLTRQLLLESLMLAVPSALAGYGLAVLILGAVERLPIPGMPELRMYFYLDGTVLAYALCAGVAATVIAGLWPARAASKPDLVAALKGGGAAVGGRKFGVRGALVAAQLALSMVGITAAAMLTKSVLDLNPFDSGVDPHKVLTASMWPAMNGYSEERTVELRRQLAALVARQPGVESVAFALAWPGGDSGAQTVLHTGSPLLPKQEAVRVKSNSVGPAYFRTLGIGILRGREYGEADIGGRPACVVNETMARRFWPGQEPLGRTVRVRTPQGEAAYEVIGVARDTGYERGSNDYEPFLYLPMNRLNVMTLLVRSSGKATALVENVRRAVASLDPDLPVLPIGALADNLLGGGRGIELRLRAAVMGTLGGTALLLSALGLYGVIAYLVTRRTREIGIRLALGAGKADVLGAVMADGARLVSVGMAAGVALSLIACPLLANGVFGVKANQPVVIAAACVVLGLVSAGAMLIPALRACKVEAITALRYE